jgi:bud site selection protein 20
MGSIKKRKTRQLRDKRQGAMPSISTMPLTFHRDLDLIKSDLKSTKHLTQHKESTAAEDLPALGEHYCIECAKWFESQYNIAAHRRGKNHKRRVRMLKEEAHSQKAADAAVGLGVDNGRVQQVESINVEESTEFIA